MNGNIFDIFLIWPILNILIAIYKLFLIIGLPGTLGLAIIALTIIIRAIMWPLSASQLKSLKKIQELRPQLENIKKNYSKDKLRQQQETAKLYKEKGINPAAGCLPTLVQIPFLIALYSVLTKVLLSNGGVENINKIVYNPALSVDGPLNLSFLSLSLAQKPSDLITGNPLAAISIPLITGGLLFLQSKMASVSQPGKKEEKKGKEEKKDMEEAMQQVQSQMVFIMPIMFAFFSFGFPIGLSLYWNTFTVLGMVQQYTAFGWGGLKNYLPKKI